ncbi:MAG: capsular polysaccharide biosynthesis protein [Clostridia bacterium]|nr:capsular polysaccharide biosynthesis protein [Clostridia bacterium]
MTFTDWHSHILPNVDDGSRDVAESLKLLEMLAEQGVGKVIATPHFIADNESVSAFIKRRNDSYNRLKEAANKGMPEIVLGAEVAYYSGISRLSNLKELCIDRTGLLLLEMPFSVWKEYTLKEVVEIATAKNIVVILAHIERYLKFQPYKTLEQLMEIGVLMQVNASYFAELRTRRKALSLLKKGGIQFLGSDCHNLTSRAPKIGTAYEVIKNKFGEDFVWQMNEYGNSLLV